MKKNKVIVHDDELILIFQWAQRIFLYSSYFFLWYAFFFLFSVFIPLIFIYFSDSNFSFASVCLSFVKDYKYLTPLLNIFFSNDYFFFGTFVFKFLYKSVFIFFNLYVFTIFLLVVGVLKYYIIKLVTFSF